MTTQSDASAHAQAQAHLDSYFAAYNSHDVDAIVKYFSDGVEWIAPDLEKPVHGRAAAAAWLTEQFTYRRPLLRPSDRLVAAGHRTRRILSHTAAFRRRGRPDPPMTGRSVFIAALSGAQTGVGRVDSLHQVGRNYTPS